MDPLKNAVLNHTRMVPRYTSYPTAPHFQTGLDPVLHEEWLKDLDPHKSVSLYVHIPFCPRLCWFCGCNTRVVNTAQPVDDYIRLLEQELVLTARFLPPQLKVRHLHFGGGSPTILPPLLFTRLMDRLRHVFAFTSDTEAAIEIDPRHFSESHAVVYAKAGIRRVSIGVQDFNEPTMIAINRPQPYHSVYKAVKLSRDYGINHLNLDLMYGLPHQSTDTIRSMMDKALTLNPDRISFFGYAHVPWMKKHMRLIPEETLPDSAARYDLFMTGREYLIQAGYVPIGIDHFARKDDPLVHAAQSGTLHRNFQGYVEDTCETLLGFGASSIGQNAIGYIQNIPHIPQYRDRIETGVLPADKYYVLTPDDRLRADIIERLMCDFSADIPAICRTHNIQAGGFEQEKSALAPLCADGLVQITDAGVVRVLHPMAARLVAAAFDAYLKPDPALRRHATAI